MLPIAMINADDGDLGYDICTDFTAFCLGYSEQDTGSLIHICDLLLLNLSQFSSSNFHACTGQAVLRMKSFRNQSDPAPIFLAYGDNRKLISTLDPRFYIMGGPVFIDLQDS